MDFCQTTAKVMHPTAASASRQAREHGRHGGRPSKPYRCPDCKAWHMTTIKRAR